MEETNVKKPSKGKRIISAIIVIAVIAVAGIYLYKQNADAPVISIDGVEFKLKDKASVLTDAGFEITGGSTLPAKSWEMLYNVEKNGVTYAWITLYNKSSSEKPLSECNIGEVQVNYIMAFDKVLIDGHPIAGVKADEVRNNLGIKEDGTVVSQKKGYATIMLSDYDASTDTYGSVEIRCDFGKKYD